MDLGSNLVGLYHHATRLQAVWISGANGQETFRFNLNIYQAASYSTVNGMITSRFVSCCQEIVVTAMKESSIHKIYTAHFLMPDRRLDISVKP